jgi:hypothetical protein
VYDLEESGLCYAPQFGAAKDPINMAGMIAGNNLREDLPLADWDQLQTNEQQAFAKIATPRALPHFF